MCYPLATPPPAPGRHAPAPPPSPPAAPPSPAASPARRPAASPAASPAQPPRQRRLEVRRCPPPAVRVAEEILLPSFQRIPKQVHAHARAPFPGLRLGNGAAAAAGLLGGAHGRLGVCYGGAEVRVHYGACLVPVAADVPHVEGLQAVQRQPGVLGLLIVLAALACMPGGAGTRVRRLGAPSARRQTCKLPMTKKSFTESAHEKLSRTHDDHSAQVGVHAHVVLLHGHIHRHPCPGLAC